MADIKHNPIPQSFCHTKILKSTTNQNPSDLPRQNKNNNWSRNGVRQDHNSRPKQARASASPVSKKKERKKKSSKKKSRSRKNRSNTTIEGKRNGKENKKKILSTLRCREGSPPKTENGAGIQIQPTRLP